MVVSNTFHFQRTVTTEFIKGFKESDSFFNKNGCFHAEMQDMQWDCQTPEKIPSEK